MFSLLTHTSHSTSSTSPSMFLPPDCIRHVMTYITDKKVLSTMYLVCRSWYHVADRLMWLTDKFYYLPQSYQVRFPNSKIEKKCRSALLSSHVGDSCWGYVQILMLTIDSEHEGFVVLPPPSIEELYIEIQQDAKIAGLSVLWAHLPYCRKVCIVCGCDDVLTDSDLVGLEKIPTLEDVFIEGNGITSVSHLSSSRSLRKLSLPYCRGLTNQGIRGLENIPTLEDLNISGTEITDVTCLSTCRVLQRLNAGSSEVTNDGIVGLENIPTLEDLILKDTNIRSVSRFSTCLKLRSLCCSYSAVIETRGLENLPNLQELDLGNTIIEDVSHLSKSRSLQYLSLSGCHLTDETIRGLENIPTLKSLSLATTRITDVSPFVKCRTLTFLDISCCTQLVGTGVRELRSNPNLELLDLD
eukprot:PhF_6_TR4870/c0_g1_i2/m.6840